MTNTNNNSTRNQVVTNDAAVATEGATMTAANSAATVAGAEIETVNKSTTKKRSETKAPR